MKVRDKKLRVSVDVKEANCVKDGRNCYWPRPDPGVFSQGQGYQTRGSGPVGWLCGTREINGCPSALYEAYDKNQRQESDE